jgi:hypothetical protein
MSMDTDIGSDEERREQGAQCGFGWVRGEGGTPRAAGAGKVKDLKEGTQQRNDGLEQTFWEICPPLKPADSRGCDGGTGARHFAGALHDVRASAGK